MRNLRVDSSNFINRIYSLQFMCTSRLQFVQIAIRQHYSSFAMLRIVCTDFRYGIPALQLKYNAKDRYNQIPCTFPVYIDVQEMQLLVQCYSSNIFLTSVKGQPLNKGQNSQKTWVPNASIIRRFHCAALESFTYACAPAIIFKAAPPPSWPN